VKASALEGSSPNQQPKLVERFGAEQGRSWKAGCHAKMNLEAVPRRVERERRTRPMRELGCRMKWGTKYLFTLGLRTLPLAEFPVELSTLNSNSF
jgi:hypothetical protein